MNLNNFTIKSQEVLQKAQEIAMGLQHQAVENAHLLKGILLIDENVTPFLFKKLEVNLRVFKLALDKILESFSKVSGANNYLSQEANATLQKASASATEMSDEFVSIEHLLLGLISATDPAGQLMADNGINEKDLKLAIMDLRKGEKVTSQNFQQKGKVELKSKLPITGKN